MLKTKTTKNIISVLSAIISVVFAFIIGVTYCSSFLIRLKYGTDVKSTQAYLANQQYRVVNDLEQSPLLYKPGIYSVNISLQYAIDYDFDLRIKYSCVWLDEDGEETNLNTDNVELLFANRDNVIIDENDSEEENYIYYINYYVDEETFVKTPAGLAAGSSELSLIAGVQIVDSLNSDYANKSLKITIDEVKIHKAGVTYDENHPLYNGVTHNIVTKNAIENNLPEGKETVYRESAKAWLVHKQSKTTQINADKAYVMVYNHRYSNETGISSPGDNSAYSKSLDGSNITASWIGGNRAYAGVGLYVITRSQPFKLSAKVFGTWRNVSNTSVQQYDSNIKFNYSSNWVNPEYSSNNLFETREYNYVIPAYSACYIEVVDSVEITTVGVGGDYQLADLDDYKLVVNKIMLNNSEETSFSYDGYDYDRKVFSGNISSLANVEAQDTYTSKDFSVANSSKFSNNLYEFIIGNASSKNYYNDNIVLFNNTNKKQNIIVNYDINYYVSNGSIKLDYSVIQNENTVKLRADSYDDPAYFRDDNSVLADLVNTEAKNYYYLPGEYNSTEKVHKKEFVLAPYSSVQIDSLYSLDLNFQSYLETKYDSRDVWVEIEAEIDYVNSSSTDATTSNLLVEMSVENSVGTIRVKNISNEVVTAISANITLTNYKHMVSSEVLTSSTAPSDWQATFWKYYTKTNGVPSPKQDKIWQANTLYRSYYENPNVTLKEVGGESTYNGLYSCVNKEVNLKPNESINLLTFTYSVDPENKDLLSSHLILNANVTASTAEALTTKLPDSEELKYPAYFVTQGVDNYYIVNTSQKSCVVRFKDSANTVSLTNVVKDGEYYYYTMVVRPGQILTTTETITDVEILPVGETYSADYLISKYWGSKTENGDGTVTYSSFIQAMNKIFS